MNEYIEQLQAAFPDLSFQANFILAPLTYFKIGGPADVYFEATTRQSLTEVVTFCRTQQIPVTILSGASNVIISDKGIRGVVIHPIHHHYQVLDLRTPDGKTVIQVDTGYKTALFVRKTVDDGYKGLEYFLGVPGQLGGAIYNNAHYLSDLIGEHIYRVEVMNDNGEICWLKQAECEFAYDDSRFHRTKEVLLRAEFALLPGDKAESFELIKKATLYRASTQPLGEPSSGCYFQNTPTTAELQRRFPQFAERREYPTAFLIDQLGLKGTQVGGVKVSEKHAAFLVNTGGGTSQDVRQLAEIIKQRVQDEYGVQLREEVFWLGEE